MKYSIDKFLWEILAIDSTTGKEGRLADFLVNKVTPQGAKTAIHHVAHDQKNVFFTWGCPKVIFCTHLDTVPPYIQPQKKAGKIYGRGACDAKGQIAAMYQACQELYQEQQQDFGLLLLAAEETNSAGAKLANTLIKGSQFIIIGEPTNRKLTTAAKGNMLIELKVSGRSAHSGYPEHGKCAIKTFNLFLNKLAKLKFSVDKKLGKTTYNISCLSTDNSHNVVADNLQCKLFFRTTFKSHHLIEQKLRKVAGKDVKIKQVSASQPITFFTVPGFPKAAVSFGSDAPSLSRLGQPILYGPGSILHAHTIKEQIKIKDLKLAVRDLKKLYYKLSLVTT